jgi:hypothetical protein
VPRTSAKMAGNFVRFKDGRLLQIRRRSRPLWPNRFGRRADFSAALSAKRPQRINRSRGEGTDVIRLGRAGPLPAGPDTREPRVAQAPAKAGRVTIAGHLGDDVAPGALNSILKQAWLKDAK